MQFGVRDGGCKQRAFELRFPEREEIPAAPGENFGNISVAPSPDVCFAATSDDPDGDKRFPLLASVRSLKTCFLKSSETASFLTMPTSGPTRNSCMILIRPKKKTFKGS